MARRILAGVRVLDITQIVAGPWCTRMLADLGADVIKVDPPSPGGTGDVPRRSAGPVAQNVGKRSIVIDLKSAEGLRIALELARRADVLVQNYRPGGLAKLGLGYDSLQQLNSRLIYASISGFGPNTPSADRGALGATAHAEAGWLWVQQQAQGGAEPFAPGVTVADIVTGMNACTAIVAALYDREHTGAGQAIDVSLMDSQLAFLAEAAAPAISAPKGAEWVPFRHGLQRAKDGYLAINLGAPNNWPRLAKAMNCPDVPMPADRAEAEKMLDDWVATRTIEEAAACLVAADAPYGVMRSMPEAVELPYFAERGMLVDVADPLTGTLRTISSPLFFSGAVSEPAGSAPLAGEHTNQILLELGYSESEVAEFAASKAVQVARALGSP
jgi:crotonobetainyl-CoA:carnitine CoA-transferase CaiB-like acyl-CoA transferase